MKDRLAAYRAGLTTRFAVRFISIVLVLTCAFAARSQTPVGEIVGQVTDASGVVVANAVVTVRELSTDTAHVTKTNSDGHFTFVNLPLGSYSIKCDSPGFATWQVADLKVEPGMSSDVNVQLKTGSSSETIEVSVNAGPRTVEFSKPIWNIWTESYQDGQPHYSPSQMTAGQSSLLVIDLAALAFDPNDELGVYSHEVSDSLEAWLKKNRQKKATLQVLIVPDPRFFERLETTERVKPLVIDLKKISDARKSGFKLKQAPLAYLKLHNGSAPFDFSEQKATFKLLAKAHAGGSAPIAISLWIDGKPIDELSFKACIKGDQPKECDSDASRNDGLSGVDMSEHNLTPDAAIHLIELGSNDMVGVFRCNVCGWDTGDYRVWRLGRSSDWFRAQFTVNVLPNIQKAAIGADAAAATPGSPDALAAQFNEGLLQSSGDYLYSLLFHSSDGDSNDAEAAFRDFVNMELSKKSNGVPPPSLFVRMLPQEEDTNFIIPVQLARIRTDATHSKYLGFIFRIQTPLDLQDYSGGNSCVKKWVLLVPPDPLDSGNPLADARVNFASWISTFKSSKSSQVFETLDDFKNIWLNPAKTPKPDSDAVLILTHNQDNTLHFKEDDAGIHPIMTRRYSPGSVIILGSCATASPKAFEFVREFNLHGADSVIAASVDVNARLGGLFLATLADQLSANNGDSRYTIDRAVFDTLAKVSGMSDQFPDKPSPYGARALIFNIIGNGNIKACVPLRPAGV